MQKKVTNVESHRQQLEAVFNEMIDSVEKYFNAVPWQWIEGEEACPEEYCFPEYESRFGRFYSWAEKWMGRLFPESIEIQERIEANGSSTDDLGELAFTAERFGFICGILVGCKAMGATRAQLEEKCRGFILPAVAHAERLHKATAARKAHKTARARRNNGSQISRGEVKPQVNRPSY